MAARRPRHRRWLVRRRRFLDAQGIQVTDTRLNIPLLPRRMLTEASPDPGVWHVQISSSPARYGVLPQLKSTLSETVCNKFHMASLALHRLPGRSPSASQHLYLDQDGR
jgi:hypothetical protein